VSENLAKWGRFCARISFRGTLKKLDNVFSVADEPMSCGKVLRKLVQRWRRKHNERATIINDTVRLIRFATCQRSDW